MDYQEFLESKKIVVKPCGINIPQGEINQMLFNFQRDIVRWALIKGKAAVFAGTGLGKTGMQLEWANQVHKKAGGDVLILAPPCRGSADCQRGPEVWHNGDPLPVPGGCAAWVKHRQL